MTPRRPHAPARRGRPASHVASSVRTLIAIVLTSAGLAVAVGSSGPAAYANSTAAHPLAWNVVATVDQPAASLTSISCPTTSMCMAVGPENADRNSSVSVVTTDGGQHWSTNVLSGLTLGIVSCASATTCLSIPLPGLSGSDEVTIDGGRTWSTFVVPRFGTQTAIACPSATTCIVSVFQTQAQSATGQERTFMMTSSNDGTTWNQTGQGPFEVTAIGCADSQNCVAPGITISGQPLAYLTTDGGAAWGQMPGGLFAGIIFSVSCATPTACITAGAYLTSATTSVGAINSTTSGLAGLKTAALPGEVQQFEASACVSAGECVVAGVGQSTSAQSFGAPLIDTYTPGGTLTPGAVPSSVEYVNGLACPTSTCFGVGLTATGSAIISSSPGDTVNAPVTGMAATPGGGGYWLADTDGAVHPHGDAVFYGDMYGTTLAAPISHIVATPDGLGYWLVAADGGIFSFGDAHFYGSMGGVRLNAPVVSMAPTADGKGYWLVASDGGIFAFGDAKFHGSMGGRPLNEPVVGISSDPSTGGYLMVATDGGIFAFDAPFLGSMGGKPLNEPIVTMSPTPTGRGYWMVATDGGIFAFGDAAFHGSMGGKPLDAPISDMAVDPVTGGYWMLGDDGGIFAFDTPFFGSS